MSEKRIENDEQLQRSLEWLLEKAKLLDHPLIDEETKAELMVKYDFVSMRVEEYRRDETIRKFPYLQRTSECFNAPKEEAHPEPIQETKKQIDLSAWMDDKED